MPHDLAVPEDKMCQNAHAIDAYAAVTRIRIFDKAMLSLFIQGPG
jgi:hypothetical protein